MSKVILWSTRRDAPTAFPPYAGLSKTGNPKLRAALYMASVSALRHNPQLRAIYDRLVANGKAKKAALGALMRHIVHIAFGVIKHQQPYDPALVSKSI